MSIFPLINSNMQKIVEKNKIKEMLWLEKGPVIKIANPKNKDKKSGIKKSENGIKFLSVSSWVNDIEIQ